MDDIVNLVKKIKESTAKYIRVCMPGKIESYDFKTQKASVKIDMQELYENGTIIDNPVVNNVPVVFMAAGGAFIKMPVNIGDTCMLIFIDRDMSNWLLGGTGQKPNTTRMHNLSDAVAIMGLFPFSKAPKAKNNEDLVISYSGSEITIQPGGVINITTTKEVNIEAAETINLNSKNNNITTTEDVNINANNLNITTIENTNITAKNSTITIAENATVNSKNMIVKVSENISIEATENITISSKNSTITTSENINVNCKSAIVTATEDVTVNSKNITINNSENLIINSKNLTANITENLIATCKSAIVTANENVTLNCQTANVNASSEILSKAPTFKHDGEMRISGALYVSGQTNTSGITNSGAIDTSSLDATSISGTTISGTSITSGIVNLSTHIHSGVTTGPGVSGPPV